MALTLFTHEYNGTTLYPLQFTLGYITQDDVYVYNGDDADYADQLTYTWADSSTIQLEAPFPELGTYFSIRRVTPRDDLLGYFESTPYSSKALDTVHLQLLMIEQELSDGFTGDTSTGTTPVRGVLDMSDYRIINLGAPVEETDAVRLVDLVGGVSEPSGIQFQDDDTYILLDNALPTPISDGDVNIMLVNLKLHNTILPKTLLASADGSHCGLSAENDVFFMLNTEGALVQTDISTFEIPTDEEIILNIATRMNVDVLEIRLIYGENTTDWLAWNSDMSWNRFFGGVSITTGVGITVYGQEYSYEGTNNTWDYANQQGTVIVSTYALYLGTIYGDNWATVDDEDVTVPISVDATEVAFAPYGTAFPEAAQDVDQVLRNIDQQFVRAGTTLTDSDPVNGTVLAAYRTWLVDTDSIERWRPLPSAPIDGDRIVIRDDTGGIVEGYDAVRPVTVTRNGNTIMGLESDLVFNTNWSWAELTWFADRNDWRITAGGVGGQVRFIPDDTAERIYPIGAVLFSMLQANPADYLQFGTWRRVAAGMFISGIGTSTDINNIPKEIASRENTGMWQVIQTEEQLAKHSHPITSSDGSTQSYNHYSLRNENGRDDEANTACHDIGESEAMNVTNPSFGMYAWERIA